MGVNDGDGTIATSGNVMLKAGAGVGAITVPQMSGAILMAEGELNATTRTNWTDLFLTMNSDTKFILTEAVSSLAANSLIVTDMSGYTNRAEAQTILDVNIDNFRRAIRVLEEDKGKTFLKGS